MCEPDSTVLPSDLQDKWALEAYGQGSDACRNYSQLTMQVRTLAQRVLLLSVAGLAVALLKSNNGGGTPDGAGVEGGPVSIVEATEALISGPYQSVVLAVGVALVVFAFSLSLIDWHYQSAFTAIRDSLAKFELERDLDGPWRAHAEVRKRPADHIATYAPFTTVALVGAAGVGVAGEPLLAFALGLGAVLAFVIGLKR